NRRFEFRDRILVAALEYTYFRDQFMQLGCRRETLQFGEGSFRFLLTANTRIAQPSPLQSFRYRAERFKCTGSIGITLTTEVRVAEFDQYLRSCLPLTC